MTEHELGSGVEPYPNGVPYPCQYELGKQPTTGNGKLIWVVRGRIIALCSASSLTLMMFAAFPDRGHRRWEDSDQHKPTGER